jgi:predicted small integral membrane protein
MTRTLAMAGMIQNGNAGTPCSASFMINREITHRTLLANFWLPLLFFALVSLLMIGPYVIPPTRITTFGNAPQDSFIFLWGLWWTKQAVFELSNPYWTDLLFYPAGTTLTFHTYPLFYGLLSLPFQLLMNGISGLVVALNVIIYLSFVLSGFGAYRLAVHVTRSRPAGLVAGLTYAFVPFHLMNMVSLNLLAMEFLPFYVLSLLKLREKPAFRSALAVALWLALTYYSSLEYALFLLIFSALWFGYELARRWNSVARAFLGYLGAAALLFLLLASPQLYQQIRVYSAQPPTLAMDLGEVEMWSPALLSLFTPTRFHPIYGKAISLGGTISDNSARTRGMRSEASLGLVALGLSIFAVFRFRQDRSAFWVIAAVFFGALTLGPHLRITGKWLSGFPMPYLLLYKIFPPLRASRDPTRFIPLTSLMLSVLAAFGLRGSLERLSRSSTRVLLTVLLAALVLFENLPGRAQNFEPSMHPAYRKIAQDPGNFAVMDLTREPFGLVQQIFHGKRITSFPRTIARSPSHLTTLQVERDFRNPELCLSLGPPLLNRRLDSDRKDLNIYQIRYAVLSPNPNLELQLKLAERLGARIERVEGLIRCEFPSAPPSQ